MTAIPQDARAGIGVRLSRPTWDGLAFGLFILVAALVIVTFKDYGVTWDEDVHNWYGVLVLDYYRSGFHDLRALDWQDLFNYGAVFDMSAAALNLVSPFGTYETRHLLNGIVGVVGLIGTWKLARQLGGPRCGLIATLLLALTPNYYGQMFNNPKDIPFAAGMVWSFYYLARLVPDLPRPRWPVVAKLGIAVGLTLGVRVGGFLLLGYLGLLLGAHVIWRSVAAWRSVGTRHDASPSSRHSREGGNPSSGMDPRLRGDDGVSGGRLARAGGIFVRESWTSFWHVLLPVIVVAYPVMLLFWPWAQWAPIAHPLSALATFSHEEFPFRTLFAGHYFPATDLPWEYLPVHILIALPELILVLLVALPIVAIVTLVRRHQSLGRAQILPLAIVAFGIVFPVAWAVGIKAVLFDGMRHFMFVLPLIATLTAVAADRALDHLAQWRVRPYVLGALALYGAGHVTEMAMLHPDEYVYYNGFIGGIEGAQGLFKLDYWANSYAEAVQGLEDYLREEYGADFMDHDFKVAVCGPPVSAAYYFPSNFIFANDRRSADFFIAFTKDNCDRLLRGKEIYRVERMGTLLSLVLDRRDIVARRGLAAVAGDR